MLHKEQTCCFTGHRKLPNETLEQTIIRLDQEVDSLIAQGVTTFMSGGALGFDQIAASLIIAKREMGYKIKLIFALPCRNQDEFWTPRQKKLYCRLLAEADEIIYASEEYTDDCMKKRNYFMIDGSAYCICALLYSFSGTAQTVKYAKQKGLKITNIVS